MYLLRPFFVAILAYSFVGLTTARPLSEALENVFSHSKRADASKVGYLAAYWHTSKTGIFFALSTNNNPTRFVEINGGKPIFVPTVGTKVIRDVSIIPGGGSDAAKKWYIIGTDLNIDATTWDACQRTGSLGVLTYESSDLVHWGSERLVKLEDDTAGMVWAPDAIWDNQLGAYFTTWSSKFYAASDTNHTGSATTPLYIRSATTKDFKTYSRPSTYIAHSADTLDQAFLRINDTALVRIVVGAGLDGPSAEVSYTGINGKWLPTTGKSIAPGYEGPYAYWDNQVNGKAYLLNDKVGGDAGLHAWYSTQPQAGTFTTNSTANDAFMRHGSVIPVTQKQYDALKAL